MFQDIFLAVKNKNRYSCSSLYFGCYVSIQYTAMSAT